MAGTTITLAPIVPPVQGGAVIPHSPRTTFVDAISHLRDYLGSNFNNESKRAIVRSIQAALRELTNVRHWSYLLERGRIQTNAPYSTGTVAFDYTGGTYERQLTLTGGTWPAWAGNGTVVINNVVYDVGRRISDTVLQFDDTITSVNDLASGTSYILYQDTFTLPEDFVASDRGFAEISWGGMEYVHPTQWLQVTRYYRSSSNTPRYYTFRGDPRAAGRMSLSLFPYPSTAATVDFFYHRRPRRLSLETYTTGTVSVNAVSGATTTVTGSGTSWTSSMVGSVIRLSTDTTNVPTGLEGSNPYVVERTIKVVSSATALTVDDSIADSYTGVTYQISDPIDVEDGAMLEAYFRCAEKHLSIVRNLKGVEFAHRAYKDALILAEEADSRSFQGRVAGEGGPYRQRLANMPISFE